jgi:hypothetical protein
MPKSKSVSIFRLAKIHAIAFGAIGLLLGILYSFGGLIIDALVSYSVITSSETPGLSIGTLMAFGALLGMPAIFAFIGLILGTIVAIIYNITTKLFPALTHNL